MISYCLVQRCLGRCRNIWLTRSAVIQLSYKKSHAPRVTRHRHTNKSHVKVTCLRSFTTAGSTLAALAPCRHPPPTSDSVAPAFPQRPCPSHLPPLLGTRHPSPCIPVTRPLRQHRRARPSVCAPGWRCACTPLRCAVAPVNTSPLICTPASCTPAPRTSVPRPASARVPASPPSRCSLYFLYSLCIYC